MRKFAKFMSLALALMLVFSALVCVSAAPVNELIGITANTASLKENGEVEITVKALADFEYTNIEFEITYDKNNFTAGVPKAIEDKDKVALVGKSAINITSDSIKIATANATAHRVKTGDIFVCHTFIAKNGVAETADVANIQFGLSVKKLNNSGTAVAEAATGAMSAPVTIVHEHKFVTHNAAESVAPGCESGGFDRHYCACGEYEDTPLSETGHDYSGDWSEVPGEDGWYQKTCGNCSAPLKTYVPSNAADDSLGVTVSAPKGAFSEKVTITVDKDKAAFKDEILENLSSDVTDYYMFDVKVLNEQGQEVTPATGTELTITLTLPDEYVGNTSAIGFYGVNASDIETLFEGKAFKNVTVSFASGGSFVVATVIPTESSDISSTEEDSVSSKQEDTSSEPLISKPTSSTTTDKQDTTSSEKPATTGDTSVIWIAVLAALVAALALALTLVLGKKKHS